MEIITGWEGRERFLAALDAALANAIPAHVQEETHGDMVNRWSGTRSGGYEVNFSRADYADGRRHGWLRVTRLADGSQAGLTALEDGRTEYWNDLPGELADAEEILSQAESWARKVDAHLQARDVLVRPEDLEETLASLRSEAE